MHKYVYGQGYTIREKSSNLYGEHKMLKVRKDGSTDFFKYYNKAAGTPWARFLNKRDAELYLIKNNLSSDDYEVVKCKHPKYMELFNDETGLYKVVSEDNYDLITFGKDKVVYFDTNGTEQSTPAIPITVKKSNKSVAWYILKNVINYWGELLKNYPVKYHDNNYSLDINFIKRSSYSGILDAFSIIMESKLYCDYDMDTADVTDLIIALRSDDNEITKGFEDAQPTWDKKVYWRTALDLPFKDILTFPILNIDYDNLKNLSDEQIFNLKKFIDENRNTLFISIVKYNLDKVSSELKKYIDSQVKDYFATEVFESLNTLSWKELFDKVYDDK